MTPGVLIALRRITRQMGVRGNATDTMGVVPGKGQTRRTIRADDDVWLPAVEVAKRLGETISDVVRESLAGYVELHTDATWAEAMALAAEPGDDLQEILREAVREYIQRDA